MTNILTVDEIRLMRERAFAVGGIEIERVNNLKFIPLSVLSSKKAEIEKGCKERYYCNREVGKAKDLCVVCQANLSLINELMEVKE